MPMSNSESRKREQVQYDDGSWSRQVEEQVPDAARLAEAVAAVTPCTCSAQRTRAERAEAVLGRVEALAAEWEDAEDEPFSARKWAAARIRAALRPSP